ncbi:MAG: hypothetical protein ACK5ZV_04575 [bacterium]
MTLDLHDEQNLVPDKLPDSWRIGPQCSPVSTQLIKVRPVLKWELAKKLSEDVGPFTAVFGLLLEGGGADDVDACEQAAAPAKTV